MDNANQKYIKLEGVKTHGLKNINLEIPHDQITVITGVSGSGKSSLAIDTIFAEGQRRYLESLSSYARQFLNKFEKPDFEKISGLRPSIAIEQKTQGYNPRSTVGTVTEIYDYLRVLYARIGTPHSPFTNLPLKAYSPSEITNHLLSVNIKEFKLISSIIYKRKGSFKVELLKLQKEGFSEIIIDDKIYSLDEIPELDKNKFHTIELLIGQFNTEFNERYEIENAIANAFEYNQIIKVTTEEKESTFSKTAICPVSGFSLTEFSPRLFSFNSPVGACKKCSGLGYTQDDWGIKEQCHKCLGLRLNEQALCVKLENKNIAEVCHLSLNQAKNFIDNLTLSKSDQEIATSLTNEISKRLEFLLDVGLHYLTMERSAETLSGGESQRIRLASQIGSGLEGVLYVLDEPSIGLHPQDQDKLINTLKKLKNLGNTILMVEHDEETMLASDYLIEIGPKAGVYGGEVVFSGTLQNLLKQNTLTSQYLKKEKEIKIEKTPFDFKNSKTISIKNATFNNLNQLNVDIPLNCLVGVCGVSGSGKSTLIMEILATALKAKQDDLDSSLCSLEGEIPPFEIINQAPIGRTPRSTPSTYTGIWSYIRDWYAQLPESKSRGYTASRFSFNVEGGRCALCKGEGVRHIEMHFLPDVEIQCEECQGKRFNKETCEIKYENLSIADVLNLSVEEALNIFNFIPQMKEMLQTLKNVKLDYIKLGQNAITLSGGEAQRIKLAKILGQKKKIQLSTLYILDEPTTGLHFDDIQALMQILNKLKAKEHSIIIIEHHCDVLKNLDWLIELGPEGGKNGGKIIAEGTYEELKNKNTPTSKFFK
ncbi:excinuclease ABC subunit UvrA [Alphaproteobacteria bacterium endosymbiont of Tiliacea citrago]|uniref:excinuclease ABC subunit UvrA n=1 Tax=Alphaproteobacteria bacterium endosymbiont of Tiliacea citrago TaxID=3077944 RepID=UPI00313CDCD5